MDIDALKRSTLAFLEELEEEESNCYGYDSGYSQEIMTHKSYHDDYLPPREMERVSTIAKGDYYRPPVSLPPRRGSVTDSIKSSGSSSATENAYSSERRGSDVNMGPRGCFKLQCEYQGKVHNWIFPGDRPMTNNRVRKTIRKKFPELGRNGFRVKYIDEEQDLVTICDDQDLLSAMSLHGLVIVL